MNINRLLPRLPIRAKLAIAFAMLATVPLVFTGVLGTFLTLRHIEAGATATLEFDLQTARERTERLMAAAQEDMHYLTATVLRPALTGTAGQTPVGLDTSLVEFVRAKPVFAQIKLFDQHGGLVALGRAWGSGGQRARVRGTYYVYRARDLRPGEDLIIPAEIAAESESAGVTAVPVISVITPLHDSAGALLGVGVGEVYAARVFEALESGSPSLRGVSAIVGLDGRFLYHSERKRDWRSLLAPEPTFKLSTELGSQLADTILAGRAGAVQSADGRLISYTPLRIPSIGLSPLVLYRAIPLSVINAPVRSFLWGVGIGGVLVLWVALALAMLAANQFTRPIYRLRESAREIAGGRFPEPLNIETSDELEELAADFNHMAKQLREHTEHLEDLVALRSSALREAHAELEEILANSEDAIVRVENDGRIRVWNQGAEKLFGYSAAEAAGQYIDRLILPAGKEHREEASLIEQELGRRGSLLDYHTTRARKDGTAVEVSLSQTVISDASGSPLGYTVIIRDVSRHKELQKQMLRSERLVAAGRLAAGIAHEINNPIGIILNRLECLDIDIQQRSQMRSLRDDLRVIRHQTERVGEVARRLLSLVRDVPKVREPLNVNQIVGRVIEFLQPTLEKKFLAIDLRLANDLKTIEGSAHDVEIVLLNLLLNAIDASSEGGTITVATRMREDGGEVELEVADTGCGVATDVLEKIFEPFFTTKEGPRGTGLGLAVVRHVVQAHGGDVAVESELGSGSRFIVNLPVRPQVRRWRLEES